jgi:hypothetical protein
MRHSNASNYWGTQVAWGWEDNANRLATRNVTGGTFGSWVYYLNSANYNSYAPTLTGTGASGTWGIGISGNAATVTNGVYTTGGQTISNMTTFNQITVTANALIGTTGTQAFLWVQKTDGNPSAIALHAEDSLNTLISQQATNNTTARPFRINVGSTESLRILTGGNVGIGTATPGEKLEVNGYILSDRYYPKSTNGTYLVGDGSGMNVSGNGYFYVPASGGSYFQGAVRLRGVVSSDAATYLNIGGGTSNHTYFAGNIGIGTTTPGYALEVTGTGYATTDFRAPIFYDSNSTSYYVNPASTSALYDVTIINSIQAPIYYDYNNTAYYVNPASTSVLQNITAVGDIRSPIYYESSNTAYYFDGGNTGDSIRAAGDIVAYYSDERLKDRKGNIENALEKVLSLNGFYYEPNERAQELGYKKKPEVGVSAQEVEAILPEIVKDAAIGYGYKTLDYSKLVPLLIEAIKEQQKQINELKSIK